jgi:NAD(P)-dependent dehydrogenase (short-subunit alcohol dehydrogenase family)
MEFPGKTALVTGCNRGIGLELCRQLAAAGCQVLASARGPAGGELAALGVSVGEMDVTSDESVGRYFSQLACERIDLLVNNAGILEGYMQPLAAATAAGVLASLDTNAVGAFRVTQAALPLLQRSAQPHVVQLASTMGSYSQNQSGKFYAYRMSKIALNMFNRTLANDFPDWICIAMNPGWVKTRMGGFEQGKITVEESVRGILSVLARAGKGDNGKILNYKGEEVPG